MIYSKLKCYKSMVTCFVETFAFESSLSTLLRDFPFVGMGVSSFRLMFERNFHTNKAFLSCYFNSLYVFELLNL